MSADNWAVCPRCEQKRQLTLLKGREALERSYGSIPSADFIRNQAKQEEDEIADPPETFREDYHIGVFAGQFEVSYSGGCTECELVFNYKFEQGVDISDPPKPARAGLRLGPARARRAKGAK